MSLAFAIVTLALTACLIIMTALHLGIKSRDAEISGLQALAETHRQEAAKLRAESNMYQNELKEVRDKCVALRERAQITEGWGEGTVLQLGTLYCELSRTAVVNRLPVRFVPMLGDVALFIKNRANAMKVLDATK